MSLFLINSEVAKCKRRLGQPLHLQEDVCSMSHLVTGKRQPKSLSRVPRAMPHCPLHLAHKMQRMAFPEGVLHSSRAQSSVEAEEDQGVWHPAMCIPCSSREHTAITQRTSAGPSRSSILHPAGSPAYGTTLVWHIDSQHPLVPNTHSALNSSLSCKG